jgi:mRNA interferase MazF
MKRGEVWWALIDERRPILILSQDEAGEIRAMVIVAPANIDIRGIAVEVKVGAPEGLSHEGVLRVAFPRPGHVNCNWLVSLEQADLLERAGTMSSEKLQQVEDILRLGGLEQLTSNDYSKF